MVNKNPIYNKSYIYIARCNEHYKIGVSTLPEQRLSMIRTDNYQIVQTVAILECDRAYEIEAYVHKFLKTIGTHVRGEWFKLDERLEDQDEALVGYLVAAINEL